MGFQTEVTTNPAPAVEGDFASANIRAVALTTENGFKAPVGGVTVGRFVWCDPDTGAVSQTYVAGYEIAFLHREQQAVITEFLGEATMVVARGIMITPFIKGEFWARFAAGATPGQNVYADPSTGIPVAGTTAPNTASVTAHAGAAFTGVVASNVLTTSSVTGTLTPGDLISSTSIVTPTVLGAQLTGTPGGAGTYTFVHANVASEAMTANSVKLQVTAVSSGALGTGSAIAGSGVTAGTTVVSQDSGTPGGVGVYTIAPRQRFASTTVTEGATATGYKVRSVALSGELAKISTW